MCNKGGVPRQIAAGVLEQSMVTGWILETVAADRSRIAYEIASWPYRIGRDVDNDLAVASGNLSRHHAEITADGPGRLRLTDLGSTNGTFVNRGARLLPGNKQPLKNNDEIIVGKTFLKFVLSS